MYFSTPSCFNLLCEAYSSAIYIAADVAAYAARGFNLLCEAYSSAINCRIAFTVIKVLVAFQSSL